MPRVAASSVRSVAWVSCILLLALTFPQVAGAAGAASRGTVVRRAQGGLQVTRDVRTDTWTIGSGDDPLAIGFDRDGALVLRGWANGATSGALLDDVADATIVLNGHEVVLGDRETEGVHFAGDRAEDYGRGLRLTLAFNVPDENARVSRHFVTYPGTSVIETWFEVERLDGAAPVSVEGLQAWRVGAAGHLVHWLHGLRMLDSRDLAFEDEGGTLPDGASVTLGAAGRSTESSMPWITVRTAQGTFFGGLMWSGAWQMFAQGNADGTTIVAGLDAEQMTVPADQPLEGLHGFFGVVPENEDIAAAMRTFLIDGLRGGREFEALVTYNTWFVHGVGVTETIALTELDHSSRVGAELFQLDAGWYSGSAGSGFDFTKGLGSYNVDTGKFPHGLRVLSDTARRSGMRFALWVEPERVDLAVVDGEDGPRESWLATSNGAYRPGRENADAEYAQLCLAHPGAWQWVFEHLSRLVEREGVDYFKVDSNDWIVCNREGHGHGTRDGSFAHVQAMYRLLAALRSRFPSLLIENCSGGGNRFDLGLARYTDAGWMDDRTVPSTHVRHNLEGLSQIFPPSYLLSYAMSSADEPMSAASDFALLTRSRMPGILGVSYRTDEIGEAEYALLTREVDVYKRARALSTRAHAIHLTARTSEASRPAWELTEHVTPEGTSGVLYAFQNDSEAHSTRVVFRDLEPGAVFDLYSADEGSMGLYSGQHLMTEGFDLYGTPNTAAQVILLQPAAQANAASRARTATAGTPGPAPTTPSRSRTAAARSPRAAASKTKRP